MSAEEWKLGKEGENKSRSRPQTANSVQIELSQHSTPALEEVALLEQKEEKEEVIESAKDSLRATKISDGKLNEEQEPEPDKTQEENPLLPNNSEVADGEDSNLFDEDEIEQTRKEEDLTDRFNSARTDQEPGLPLTERQKIEMAKVMRRITRTFDEFSVSRDTELVTESKLLDQLVNQVMSQDFKYMDKIESENISIYSAITRQKLRDLNQNSEIVKAKYMNHDFNIVDLCFLLVSRNSTALGYENEKLMMMISMFQLILECFEYGLFPIDRIRKFQHVFFLKTEFVNKQEEYISKHEESFAETLFDKLMICKSLCSRILLQLVTMINDDWLYHNLKEDTVDELIPKEDKGLLKLLINKKKETPKEKEHNILQVDVNYYSRFSFMMFNYLLKELTRGDKIFSCPKYLSAMHLLILYVYDHREDPFVISLNLLKAEYLPYYIGDDIEPERIKNADEILLLIHRLKRSFELGEYTDERRVSKSDRLEGEIGNIFGRLEILMGLQDETYSIRLMLTERNIPACLIDIFLLLQSSHIGESADELFIQGLKVLYQLCKGNYPGQAQITKGASWDKLKQLITGSFSVFNILFLKQLFEEDTLYLHINTTFSKQLIDLFSDTFDKFFQTFSKGPIRSAKDLVSLYAFKSLVNLLIKSQGIPIHVYQSYNMPISKTLQKMVENFAFPLFKENYIKIDKIYEPKLISKNWKLEDGSFLVSLMMLSGDQIKCMMVDFAYSLIRLYNKSCENYFPSQFYEGMYKCLPLDLSNFDYLLTFAEGIKFKTEIINSYCIFRIFGQSSKIQEKYTTSELSLEGVDTNLDFLPDNHIKELPDMIINELTKFKTVHDSREFFEKEDLIEYLLRGIGHMCYKFANGVIWYFLSLEKEEIKLELNTKLQIMNEKLKSIVRLVMEEKEINEYSSENIKLLKKVIQDPQSGVSDKLGNSLVSLIEHLEMMYKSTNFDYVPKKYTLNLKYLELENLSIAGTLLRCEASYLASTQNKKSESKKEKEDIIKVAADHPLVKSLINQYTNVKKIYLTDKKKNRFFQVLESKMEDTNQLNLISYIIHSLEGLDFAVCGYQSLWFDKKAMNTIVFLNNAMFWCTKTRTKLYEYLAKHPHRRQKLFSVIYKCFRDSYSILTYTPFYTESWEHLFAKFYTFGSFIRGVCNQNCQEFKIFIGQYKPNFKCPNHSALNNTILHDMVSILMKFLNFSGISFNKNEEEYPSDRLSTIIITETLYRCIIDALTGPCKVNQLSIYNKGSIIWLNIFNRIIKDLDSKYYNLMNLVLDYLLSLIEGNSTEILQSFATTFDIPVLYNDMSKLLTLLWQRVMRKRRKDLRRALEQKKRKDNLINSKASLNSSDSKKEVEKSSQLIITTEEMKIDNWNDLITMYMNGDFGDHMALSCSIKIYIFLSRVSYKSKKYEIFFDIKEDNLKTQYIAAGFKEEDIRLGKVALKGKTLAATDLIVYYFMKKITSQVEIKDSNHNSEIFIFPKRPMCFFLRETTKQNFIDTCNIENTEAKLIDMFESFKQFYLEMKSHQKFKSEYRFIGRFATDRSFKILRIFCYMMAIAINGFLLYDVEFRDFRLIQDESVLPVLVLSAVLDFVSLMSIGLWLMSNYKVAWIESYRKFTVKNPYRNPYQPINLVIILSEVFLRKDVINFVLHFMFATLGVSYNTLVQCFHLVLIVNISETTKYVIKAITKHIDQLFATITLVIIFIYIFSNFLGKSYGPLFNPDFTNQLQVCSTLKSCFFTTVNLGLRLGGGIAEAMQVTDVESRKYNFYGKLLFDLGFFLFVNVVSLNVIFGIIIDTFSELRIKQREREFDQNNFCDICGIEKKIFEKKGLEFNFHKIIEHNLWDYVFYLVYLHTLEAQNLTGFEHFVMTKFKQKSCVWLPINSTLYLTAEDAEDNTLMLLQREIKDVQKSMEAKLEDRFNQTMRAIKDIKILITTMNQKPKIGDTRLPTDRSREKSRDHKGGYGYSTFDENDSVSKDVFKTVG